MKRLIAALALTLLLASVAVAAISLTITKVGVMGDLRYAVATLDLDSSYRRGGESVTAANLGFSHLLDVDLDCVDDGYLLQYDYDNEKVLAFCAAGTTLIHFHDAAPDTNAVDLSGVTGIRVFALGW